MKRLALLALLIIGSAATLSAQNSATIRASNYGATGGAIYYMTAGTLLSGDYNVEMFGGASASSLVSIASGKISSDSGYFDFGYVVVPGVTAAADAFFQVKAWKGATFDTATENGLSTVWSQKTASWNNDPMTPMSGDDGNMPSFIVTTAVIPEPSTIALGLLGVAALLLRRRQ